MLPPTYPSNPALFAVAFGTGLWESSAGDGTFTLVLPQVEVAAMSPDSTAGDTRVAAVIGGPGAVAGQEVVIYDSATHSVTAPAILPAGFEPTGVVVAAADRVIVTGYPPPSATLNGWVSCTIGGSCSAPTWVPNAQQLLLAASPDVLSNHLVAMYSTTTLALSRDGGLTFGALATAPGNLLNVTTIARGPAGPRMVLAYSPAAGSGASVYVSDDLGQTFTSETGNLDATSRLLNVFAYPDGSVLAALGTDATRHFAIEQTNGNGIWTKPS
jgi:hypothetical protein